MNFRTSYITAMVATAVLAITTSSTFVSVHAADALKITGPDGQSRQVLRQYGPTTNADTFWSIAQKMRPDPKLSIYQVMAAIYDANPHAFSNPNYNSLEKGMILLIPSKEAMAGIPKTIAKQRAERDDKGWSAATKVVPKPKAKPIPQVQAKSKLVIAKPDVAAAEAITANDAKLEVLADKLAKADSKNLSLTDALARAQDQVLVHETDLAAFETRIDELNEKISMLEEALQVSKQRNAALKSEQVTNVQPVNPMVVEEPDDLWRTIMSNPLYLALGAAIPALLLLFLLWAFLRRRKNKDMNAITKAASTENDQAGEISMPDSSANDFDSAEPGSIDDLLDMDNVDLKPEAELQSDADDSDELFVDSTEDDIDDLDAPDDEDGQSLDDLWAEAMGDDDDDSSADGIQLEQDSQEEDLDALLAGFDEQPSEAEEDDLDSLLADLDSEFDAPKSETSGSEESISENDDANIDAALPELDSPNSAAEEVEGAVIDDEDLDALLADFGTSSDEVSDIAPASNQLDSELSEADTSLEDEPAVDESVSSDDIDALLTDFDMSESSISSSSDEEGQTDSEVETHSEETSVDDIDALLADFNTELDEPADEVVVEIDDVAASVDETNIEAQPATAEDIDSLLEDIKSENTVDAALPETLDEIQVEDAKDVPDDLNNLIQELDSVDIVKNTSTDDLDSLIAELEVDDSEIELDIEDDEPAIDTESSDVTDELKEKESSFFNDLKASKASSSNTLDWELADSVSPSTAPADVENNPQLTVDPDVEVSDEQLLSAFTEHTSEEEVLTVEDDFSIDDEANLTVEQALAALDAQTEQEVAPVPEHDLASFQQDNGFIDIDKLLNDADEDDVEQDLYKDIDVDMGDMDSLMANTPMVDVDDEENSINAKLDLARAYIEIDDEDSAKALLTEVLIDGNDRQKAESSVLLEDMQ